jgi:hypothetical protein
MLPKVKKARGSVSGIVNLSLITYLNMSSLWGSIQLAPFVLQPYGSEGAENSAN